MMIYPQMLKLNPNEEFEYSAIVQQWLTDVGPSQRGVFRARHVTRVTHAPHGHPLLALFPQRVHELLIVLGHAGVPCNVTGGVIIMIFIIIIIIIIMYAR